MTTVVPDSSEADRGRVEQTIKRTKQKTTDAPPSAVPKGKSDKVIVANRRRERTL
jgi:hypothetical protein